MTEEISEYQKNKFIKFLNVRLASKQSVREDFKSSRNERLAMLVKTEIAELEVIKYNFENIFNERL